MGLVAPGICRFAVNQTLGGRDVVNIIDMKIDTTGEPISRTEAIRQQAEIIVQEWTDHVLPMVVDDLTAVDVSWVDLDEADGSTGSTSEGSGAAAWPENGASTGAPLPANVSVLVAKQITATRTHRSGRMYLAGFSEVITAAGNGNVIDPLELADINDNLESLLGNINQEGPFDSNWHVVHTLSSVNPSPPPKLDIEFNGDSEIQSLVADALLATQRRRLRG